MNRSARPRAGTQYCLVSAPLHEGQPHISFLKTPCLAWQRGLSLTPSDASANASTDQPSPSFPELTTIYGGKTQSTDPTRMDYVPASNSPHGNILKPMNASGSAVIGGFTMTVGGAQITIPKTTLTHYILGVGSHNQFGVGIILNIFKHLQLSNRVPESLGLNHLLDFLHGHPPNLHDGHIADLQRHCAQNRKGWPAVCKALFEWLSHRGTVPQHQALICGQTLQLRMTLR